MKTIKKLLVGSLLLPAVSLFAAVDLPTLAHDAADNVFSGKNYSWTTITTRPDGKTITINGQESQTNVSVSIQDGTTTRTLMIVSGVPYVLTDSGWQKAGGRPPAGSTPPADMPPPPADGSAPGGRGGPGGHGGFGPGAHAPDAQLTHIISEVTSWSADGDLLTGQFSGTLPAPGGRHGPANGASASGLPAAPTETGVVKLWVQGGLLSKAEVTSTVTFTPPSGTAVTRQHDEVTTFFAVGTTTVTIPAALQTLISSSGS